MAWCFLGVAIGRVLRRPDGTMVALWVWRPRSAILHLLTRAGRASLAIYLIHQPVLIALLAAVVWGTGSGQSPFAGSAPGQFTADCRRACEESHGADACRAYCACLTDRATAEGLMAVRADDDAGIARLRTLAVACWEAPE